MKSLFQRTILGLWLASLLVSTTGVALHRVYCFCKKEATLTLFFEGEDACHAEKKLEKLPACCQKVAVEKASPEPSCCSKKGDEKSGCTKRDFQFSKLDTKFLKAETETQLVDYQVVATKTATSIRTFLPSFFESEKAAAASLRGPPPRFAGRALRVFLMSFRC